MVRPFRGFAFKGGSSFCCVGVFSAFSDVEKISDIVLLKGLCSAVALEALNISAADLLASEGLAGILTYHVVAGKLMAADVIAAVEAGGGTAMVETVNGAEVTVTIEDGMVILDGSAKVAVADLAAGNGVVHVIDGVILPPTE